MKFFEYIFEKHKSLRFYEYVSGKYKKSLKTNTPVASTPEEQTPQAPPILTETDSQPLQPNPFDYLNQTFRFVAVDVETANGSASSICQIGFALVNDVGKIEVHSYLIDPEDRFESFNVQLHGIDEDVVNGQPTFLDKIGKFRPFLERHTLIQHSSFDKRAFDAACSVYGVPQLQAKWLDSVRIAREAWPELKGNGGHGLGNLKLVLGLDFQHHDAGEDAKTAAQVVLLAEKKTKLKFETLASPKKKTYAPAISLEGDKDGPLYGHVACFSGALTLTRTEAATIAAGAGITVKASISKKVTLLIVGEHDLTLLAGHEKSSKHRRAEELIAENHDIRIIGEREFLDLLGK